MEKNDSGTIDIRRTVYEIRKHWLYYVIAFVLFVGAGAFYVYKKNPVYLFHANMLVEQGDGGGGSSGMMAMMRNFSIGSFSAGSVDDELLVISSHSLVRDMVKSLGLNRTYVECDGVKNLPLYKKSPVDVLAPEAVFDTLSTGASFTIKIKPDGLVDVKVKQGRFTTVFNEKNCKLPITVALPTGGTFVIDKTSLFKKGEKREIKIALSSYDWITEKYLAELSIGPASKQSNGISCELEDNDTQRGLDVLNTLFGLYNERRIDENVDKTSRELKFLDERLATLTGQLHESERKLEEFKTGNNLTDLETEAKVLLEQATMNNQMVVQHQTQLAIFDMIEDFLQDPANQYSLIPVTSGVEYESAAKSIGDYNDLVLQRMRLDMSAKKDNKSLQILNAQIDAMRAGVMETIKKARESAEIAFRDYSDENGKYAGRMRSLPSFEREYVNLTRDREIKNSLYMFLIEQRESSLLKIGAVTPMGRMVDYAYRDVEPVAPSKIVVFGLALVLALLLPTCWCVYRALTAKKLILSADIDRYAGLPVVAEVGKAGDAVIDFTEDSKEAEDIRRLRNCLLERTEKTIAISSLQGGEGKSFIASNLAKSLSLSSHRVALLDLTSERKTSITLGVNPSSGVVDYVGDSNMSASDILEKSDICENVDVAVMGREFIQDALISARFSKLLAELKDRYDYVLVVLPSMDGSSSSERVADLCEKLLLVVRSGQLRKRYMPMFRRLSGNADAAVVLNCVNE